MNRTLTGLLLTAVAAIACSNARAELTFYDNLAAWQSASGPTTKLGFDDLPQYTVLSTQYESQGITFGFGDPDVINYIPGSFEDGWGFDGNCIVDMHLTQPISAFAATIPGGAMFQFYLGGQLVGQMGFFVDQFAGFTSDLAFDRVLMKPPLAPPPFCDEVFVDDIYFQTIPAPGAGALLGVVLFGSRRRR